MQVPEPRVAPAALLKIATDTLRHLGPQRFNLTAVADAAGVSRGTVHNVLGTRNDAIASAFDRLACTFLESMAAEVESELTLAEQVAAAAAMLCAHRRNAEGRPRAIDQSVLVLLLDHYGEDLMRRSVALWKPLVKAAQLSGEVGDNVDPSRASDWIIRILFSFELLPQVKVDVDDQRELRSFVVDHVVAGLTGDIVR